MAAHATRPRGVEEGFGVLEVSLPNRIVLLAEAEQYLITVFRPLLSVHSSPAIYVEALRISAKHKFAWYDSLIVAAALEGGCDVLYSEELQHGREIEGLRIENPFV